MSDLHGTERLLAGHAPAVMVGGMRVGGISRPERTKSESKSIGELSGSDEEKNVTANDSALSSGSSPDKNNNKMVASNKTAAGMVVNGVQVGLKEAFPTEAVKHTHEKAHEQNFRLDNKKHQNHYIFQPRSFVQPSK